MYQRPVIEEIVENLKKDRPLIQAIIGPRQVGKSTAAKQLSALLGLPTIMESADSHLSLGFAWIETQWRRAESLADEKKSPVLLILDEIQKVTGWSEVLKALWDKNHPNHHIKVLVLGSSALLVQSGLKESLAGRFYLHRFTHWTYPECRDAFGWTLEQWLFFGGYPGAAKMIDDESEWKQYIRDSLIESVLAKDVLQLKPIRKPVLLRQLFMLSTAYPSQIFSYNNMLGQLDDAGNTTTLADYMHLLGHAFLLTGLKLFTRREIRKQSSSPKLILWNNALINAISLKSRQETLSDTTWWGRLVENAVGAHLLNQLQSSDWDVSYWRKDAKTEVDFVITHGRHIWAIEVKSGYHGSAKGLTAFKEKYPEAQVLLVGDTGIPLETFFSKPATYFFKVS